MFSGGTYDEVGRWLWNFLTAHAKRVDPRAEVILEPGHDARGASYAVRFRLRNRLSAVWEFDYREVAEKRGNLVWCRSLAEQAATHVREPASPTDPVQSRAE